MKTLFIIGITLLTLSLSIPAFPADELNLKEHLSLKESARIICTDNFEDKSNGFMKCFEDQLDAATMVYYGFLEPISELEKGDGKTLLQLMVLYCNDKSIDDRKALDYQTNLKCLRSET